MPSIITTIYTTHPFAVKNVFGMNVHEADVVSEEHTHHGLRGVRAKDPSLEPGLFRQVRQARRVIQMKMGHEHHINLKI